MALLAGLGSVGSSRAQDYVVQKGENLSTIIHDRIPGPVWGKNGTLQRVLKLNPEISDPNQILEGAVIVVRLPDDLPVASIPGPEKETAPEKDPESASREIASTPVQPAPAPASAAPEEEPSKDRLSLSLDTRFTSLEATEAATATHAQLNSSHDVGVNAKWTQNWSPKFDTSVEVGMESIDFQASTNASKTLATTSHTLSHIEVGGISKLNDIFSAAVFFGYGEYLFVHGVTTSIIGVDAIALPEARLYLSAALLSHEKLEAGLYGEAGAVGPGSNDSYTVKTGSFFGSGAYIERKWGRDSMKALRFSAGYEKRHQKTSILDIDQSGVAGKIQFSCPLF